MKTTGRTPPKAEEPGSARFNLLVDVVTIVTKLHREDIHPITTCDAQQQ